MVADLTPATGETRRQRIRRLARLDRHLDAMVFVAALMSIPVAAQPGDLTGAILVVDVVAWLIFVVEAVVKVRAHGRQEYLADRWNWADLAIIVLSAPYHLATGLAIVARLGSLARLARLVRIGLIMVKVVRQGRRVLSRRNVPVAVALVALVASTAAAFVFLSERGVNGDVFGSYGDALWWSIVTLTTVGYGDIAPVTIAGRVGAVVLMIVGVAFLGTIAATLASLFVGEEEAAAPDSELAQLRAEVAQLRQSVDALTARLER